MGDILTDVHDIAGMPIFVPGIPLQRRGEIAWSTKLASFKEES